MRRVLGLSSPSRSTGDAFYLVNPEDGGERPSPGFFRSRYWLKESGGILARCLAVRVYFASWSIPCRRIPVPAGLLPNLRLERRVDRVKLSMVPIGALFWWTLRCRNSLPRFPLRYVARRRHRPYSICWGRRAHERCSRIPCRRIPVRPRKTGSMELLRRPFVKRRGTFGPQPEAAVV